MGELLRLRSSTRSTRSSSAHLYDGLYCSASRHCSRLISAAASTSSGCSDTRVRPHMFHSPLYVEKLSACMSEIGRVCKHVHVRMPQKPFHGVERNQVLASTACTVQHLQDRLQRAGSSSNQLWFLVAPAEPLQVRFTVLECSTHCRACVVTAPALEESWVTAWLLYKTPVSGRLGTGACGMRLRKRLIPFMTQQCARKCRAL